MSYLGIKKTLDLYGGDNIKFKVEDLILSGEIPTPEKYRSGVTLKKGWDYDLLPTICEKIGRVKKPSSPLVLSVFTTKGGVLKSTVALNLARVAALHNIKTCVIGLDMQGDITRNLGLDDEENEEFDGPLSEVLETISEVRGLPDYFNSSVRLIDTIRTTDIPTLFFIPETPELVSLNEGINNINRREYWIRDKVIQQLKGLFDLIIMDCSPNWNKLTTNALVASDILISPLECKINNFRNFKVFSKFLTEFKGDMELPLETVFIPTRYSRNKKLTMEIREWYQSNVEGCTTGGIRESVASEEATALNISLLEHCPSKEASKEMRELIVEIFEKVERISSWKSRELESGYISNQSCFTH
jgi:chromosome partitioning protein